MRNIPEELRSAIVNMSGVIKLLRKRGGVTDQEFVLIHVYLRDIEKGVNEVLSGKKKSIYRFLRRTFIRR